MRIVVDQNVVMRRIPVQRKILTTLWADEEEEMKKMKRKR